MKRCVFAVLLLSMLSLSSCDSFRKIAGRPTSDEIEAKRAELIASARKVEAAKARQKEIDDSLAMAKTLRDEQIGLKKVEDIGELYCDKLEYRYYVIVGCFKEENYLNAMIKDVAASGYIPILIRFTNGFTAVGVAAENSLYEAGYALKGVQREKFCPDDVWILYNRI